MAAPLHGRDLRAEPASARDAPRPAPSTGIRARGLVKTFGTGRGARSVLRGVDLDVVPGELVAVTGKSGSGKSTLLHLLGALDRPDAGTIEVAGRPLGARGEKALAALRRRHVGLVFQFFHLIPELTGEENVLLPARVPGAAPQAARRAARLIDDLGLRDVATQLPHELSGGEQQRFAIARALVNDPDVLLADEPTGNLDSASSSMVLELIRSIADGGRAVVVVTHEKSVTGIADRVVELRDGRVVG